MAQFLYVGMQVAVWSFTIRLALELGDINERDASTFMVYSFACFFIGKFIANILMTRFNPEKVLILYSVIGALFPPTWRWRPALARYTWRCWSVFCLAPAGRPFMPERSIPSITSIPKWRGGHRDGDCRRGGGSRDSGLRGGHVPLATALIPVSMLCFVYVGVYFWRESKVRGNRLKSPRPEEINHDNTYYIMAGAF